MPKHNETFLPSERKILVDEEENLLPAAMKAEMYIDTFCDGITTCGKCEIKPLITEPTSPKHPKTNAILWKKHFLRGPSDSWRVRYLFKNNQNVTN